MSLLASGDDRVADRVCFGTGERAIRGPEREREMQPLCSSSVLGRVAVGIEILQPLQWLSGSDDGVLWLTDVKGRVVREIFA